MSNILTLFFVKKNSFLFFNSSKFYFSGPAFPLFSAENLLIFFAVFFHSLSLCIEATALTMLLKYADKAIHKIIVCLFILRSVY